MTTFEKTAVTCIESDATVTADILEKTGRRLKVALAGSNIALTLFKSTPHATRYVGILHGMKFTSTG